MRDRERILSSLESMYREAFESAQAASDEARADRLDFEFQRDQLQLEVLLDLRDLLRPVAEPASTESLFDKARAIRRFTRPR